MGTEVTPADMEGTPEDTEDTAMAKERLSQDMEVMVMEAMVIVLTGKYLIPASICVLTVVNGTSRSRDHF